MIALFKFRYIILLSALFSCTAFGFAQDSVKKVKTLPVKPAAKYDPYNRLKPSAYQKPVAGTLIPAQTQVKKDTAQAIAGENPALLNDKTLNGQYQYLLSKVYRYQQPLVMALWKNYSDTLNVTRKKLKDAVSQASAQTKTIDTLKKEASSKQEILTASNAKMDEITLLGMPMTKANYNLLMWGLVIAFGAAAAIIIARSGSYSREAKYRIKLYNELEEEYKTYKAKANEKEKKLARELQTERNKLDELLGNG